ncbi:MAG: hypothetical protein A4S09_13690 [Proteobacteria bacterium SG_bin7]|nr:MAG: hypothetical protein A4S09_13690 [Proteobacteria bacterium SG_bin7]
MKRTLPGVNIQFPISQLILSGEKKVETRTYGIPQHYLGVPLYLIETPGEKGNFKSRVAGIIKFGSSIRYQSKKQFGEDFKNHRVDLGSKWDWKEKPKWGWSIVEVTRFKEPIPLSSKKGIRFTKSISIEIL